MKPIIIVGHINPDTDSIVASVVFADFLKKIKKNSCLGGLRAEPRIPGELGKEAMFALDYFQQKPPSKISNLAKRKVFLIDHGGYDQAVKGIEKAEIVGILDHHKLDGIKTDYPIFYRAEPIGATSAILAKMFLENKISFSKKQAGLLLAGILSDTLNLSSPTTTREDRDMVKILSRESGENPGALSQKMFEAKSDISDVSLDDLVKRDYKEFNVKGAKFGIGVWETVDAGKIKEKKQDIFSALEKLKNKRKINLIFFAIVDILKKKSEFLLPGEKEKEAAEKAFKKKAQAGVIVLPGVVSRKKQMLPLLIKFLEKNKS